VADPLAIDTPVAGSLDVPLPEPFIARLVFDDFFVALAVFAVTRFVVVFLAGAAATVTALARVFFAAAFFTDAVLPAAFLTAVPLAARFFATGATALSLVDALASIRNFERSFTSLIHAGGRAQPLQVSPVFGFRYLAGSLPLPAD
jgi:hypothetical protein